MPEMKMGVIKLEVDPDDDMIMSPDEFFKTIDELEETDNLRNQRLANTVKSMMGQMAQANAESGTQIETLREHRALHLEMFTALVCASLDICEKSLWKKIEVWIETSPDADKYRSVIKGQQ